MSAALAWGLAAAAGALLLRGLSAWRSRRDRRRLADRSLLARLGVAPLRLRGGLRTAALVLGAGLVGAAAGGLPSGGADGGDDDAVPSSLETVLVLDASNSMLARDVAPSRLERQRELAREMATRLPGEVGVVYFAGRGYVLAPLTADRSAVIGFVDAVRPASVGRGGSALAAGLGEALDVLAGGRADARKSVVLFSDGEETLGEELEGVLERAVDAEVAVHTVGVGTVEGAPIPLGPDAALDPAERLRSRRSLGETDYLRGPDGEVVITRLGEEMLGEVADETGGSRVAPTPAAVRELAERMSAGGGGRPGPGSGPAPTLLLVGAFLLLWLDGFGLARG